MHKYIFVFLYSTFLIASTPEQVEEYLFVSNAEEQLIQLQSQYATMQNSAVGDITPYDMQLLMIRFKEKLQKQLSEDEMDDILSMYKNVVYLQFTATQNLQTEFNQTAYTIDILEDDPEYQEKKSLIKDILKAFNKKEIIEIMYDDLMIPFMKQTTGGASLSTKMLSEQKEAYVNSVIKSNTLKILNNTKDLSVDELQKLLDILKSSAIEKEKKAIYKATAYAFKEYFLSIAKRYNLSQQQLQHRQKPNNI